MQHQYTKIPSDNLTISTNKNLFDENKDDYCFYTVAIMVSEKLSSMLSSYSFLVIVSSSVFRYIEKTTPKINEYQQLYSEPIPSLNHTLYEEVNSRKCFCLDHDQCSISSKHLSIQSDRSMRSQSDHSVRCIRHS